VAILALRPAIVRGVTAGQWALAAGLTLAGNIAYYLLLVWSIRLAGAAMPTLIIGLLPVTLALAGNAVERSVPVARLPPSGALIVAGLLLVNAGETARSGPDYLLGLALAVAAHLAWLAYGLANARFLKQNPDRDPDGWAAIVGVATLPLSLLLWIGGDDGGSTVPRDWTAFIGVCAAFGLLSSWAATLFWNRASQALPTALAAQLIVVETIGALLYAWTWYGALPALPVLGGAALLIVGVVFSVQVFVPNKAKNSPQRQ
jgi:drug/metabolite transporter (DMT)-like permease